MELKAPELGIEQFVFAAHRQEFRGQAGRFPPETDHRLRPWGW